MTTAKYAGTTLSSGTTEIAVTGGDIIEVVNLVAGRVANVRLLNRKKPRQLNSMVAYYLLRSMMAT